MSNPKIKYRFRGYVRVKKDKNNEIGYIFNSPYHIQKGIELTVTNNIGYNPQGYIRNDKNYGKEITQEDLVRYLGQKDLTIIQNIANWYRTGTKSLLYDLMRAEKSIAYRNKIIKENGEAFTRIKDIIDKGHEDINQRFSTTVQPQKSEQSIKQKPKKKSFFAKIFRL